jgi:hypothetical protein
LTILILRFPNLILFEQNPDESQWMAGAATLLKDCRFWLSVDGTTSGPLVIFPLALINLIGGSINYATVRLFGLLFCVIPSVLFLYLTFKNFFDGKIARIIILPLVVCMSFMNFWDIIAYNSEHIPMLMISLSILFYGEAVTTLTKNRPFYLFLLGFTLGCVPYSKLQAVPIALGIAIFICITLIIDHKNDIKKLSKTVYFFVAGGLFPSIFVSFYLLYFGIFKDFLQSYILNNLSYVDKKISWFSRILILPNLIMDTPHTKYYFVSLSIYALISSYIIFRSRSHLTSVNYKVIDLSFVILATAYYSIILSGNYSHHYQVLIIIPAIFLSGTFVGIIYQIQKEIRVASLRFLPIIFIAIAVVFPSSYTLLKGSAAINYLKANGNAPMKSKVARKISEYAQPNERMAIWGWMNNYYVETGLLQGTREAHSERQIENSFQQNYYLKRYVSDIIKNKPLIFLDAVGSKSFYYNNVTQRHENYSIIKAIIDKYYSIVAERDEIRIYVLKKRLPELLIKYSPTYELGKVINFGSSGSAKDYFLDGWSIPEKDFTWIVSKERASLEISIPSFKGEALTLSAKMFPFIVPGKLDKQRVKILINGKNAGEWEFREEGHTERKVLIPKALITSPNLVITFVTPNAAKPKDIGANEDTRVLSVAFINLTLYE